MLKQSSQTIVVLLAMGLAILLFVPEIHATTILSKPVSEYTVEAEFIGRIRVDSFNTIEISGFPHRVIIFTVLEVFKGRGEPGDVGRFTVPGGRRIGTDKVFAIGGGITSFLPSVEYMVFLKNMPSFGSPDALQSDEIPNTLVGWTALQVVYENGQRGLKQVGTIGQMHNAVSLSGQQLIRDSNTESTRAYGEVVDEIARHASE